MDLLAEYGKSVCIGDLPYKFKFFCPEDSHTIIYTAVCERNGVEITWIDDDSKDWTAYLIDEAIACIGKESWIIIEVVQRNKL